MPDSPPLLSTEHLDLLRAAPAHLRALIEGVEVFERRCGMPVREDYLEFPEAHGWSLSQAESAGVWWLPYLYIDRRENAVVGLGGYKGPPGDRGMVKIGYGVAPAYRGRGYATKSARSLVEGAFAVDGVAVVCAHTLPERNASVRVLERCGFRHVDVLEDPDDGVVWRWEIGR